MFRKNAYPGPASQAIAWDAGSGYGGLRSAAPSYQIASLAGEPAKGRRSLASGYRVTAQRIDVIEMGQCRTRPTRDQTDQWR